jgi:dTDP-4-amino-4,6-dideoxygalactose transaminase
VASCRLVFCDSRLDTATISLDHLKSIVTSKTRVVCIVNYNGYGEDLHALSEYCEAREILLVEDNAHGFGTFNKGKLLGSFGYASSTSFGYQKNISCGQGGALYLKDKNHFSAAQDISCYGANISDFRSGNVSRYSWSRLGSNYRLSEIAAAILSAQLEEFQSLTDRRRLLWIKYWDSLIEWSNKLSIRLPPIDYENSYHIFWILLPDELEASRFIDYMTKRSIEVLAHYFALHCSSMGIQLLRSEVAECQNAERLSSTLVRLPLNNSLSAEQQDFIIDMMLQFS